LSTIRAIGNPNIALIAHWVSIQALIR